MIIYRITNKLDGKTYIGQTRKTLAERIKAHIYGKSRIGKAIVELGINNFDISVIDNAETENELDELEKFWIAFYNSQENGYNVLSGGKPTKDEFKLLQNMPRTKKPRRAKHKRCYIKKLKEKARLKEKVKATTKVIEKITSSVDAKENQFDEYLDALSEVKRLYLCEVL